MLRCLVAFLPLLAAAQNSVPQPKVVTPAGATKAPSDAVVLFDGSSLTGWTKPDGSPTGCTIENGAMACRTGAGDAVSRQRFASAQIHLEFNIPNMPNQKDQLKGNSGVYLHGCYELQVLDSFENPTYPMGQCGALYGFAPPLVNASLPPGQWQTYDILFRAPKCSADGAVREPGYVTVFHNGVLIQDRVPIARKGDGCQHKSMCDPGPLRLQDHSGFKDAPDTTMRFRNIWIRQLD
jgi:hypothetical protein